MGKVISIVNRKGGVGKTTLTVGMAETLVSDQEASCVVLDLDPQSSATHMLCDNDRHYHEITARRRNLVGFLEEAGQDLERRLEKVVIPDRHSIKKRGHVGLALVGNSDEFWDFEADSLRFRKSHELQSELRQLIGRLAEAFDYVLVDCPPGQSLGAETALKRSDLILCPITPDRMALWGKDLLTRYVGRIAPRTPMRFVVTRAVFNTSLAGDMFVEIDKHEDMLPAEEGVFRFAYFSQSAHVTRRLTIDKPNRTLEQLWGKQAARELRQIARQVDKVLTETGAPHSASATETIPRLHDVAGDRSII